MTTVDGAPVANARRTALVGVVGAAVMAACLLPPGLGLGVSSPWLGALVVVIPTMVLLTVAGYRHYGFGRALAIAFVVTLVADGIGWAVAVSTLVKALSGDDVAPVWVILSFATPAIAVLALGALALRLVPPRSPG